MNLLQKAIIKNSKKSRTKDFNKELALEKGTNSFEETLNQLIKLRDKLSQEEQDKYIPYANLLLDVLKGNQTCTDKQIQTALEKIWDAAFYIWWGYDYDPESQKLLDAINDVYVASL